MMRGQNPDNILNSMVKSGKINQNQLNQVQQKAKELENNFAGFKQMFGFK